MKGRKRESYKALSQTKKDAFNKRKYLNEQNRFAKMTTEQKQEHLKHRVRIVRKSQEKRKVSIILINIK